MLCAESVKLNETEDGGDDIEFGSGGEEVRFPTDFFFGRNIFAPLFLMCPTQEEEEKEDDDEQKDDIDDI